MNARALEITLLNSTGSITTASDGVTTTFAAGSSCRMDQQAQAMQGAVFRAAGSARMCDEGMSGSWSWTISTYASLVTTQKFSFGQRPLKRSTVSWIKVRPQPRMSMNCLGRAGVLRGQKRLPMPPAIITIWLFLAIVFYASAKLSIFFLYLHIYA